MDAKKTTRYQVTIMSAIDELQRAYRMLNDKYFDNELEPVIITIQTDAKRQAYAWLSVGKVWSANEPRAYREINIVAEWLARDPELVIASLLHEMCHLYNLQHDIQDCSRSGSYHNEHFRDAALAHGLNCEKVPKYGWTYTTPSDGLIAWTKENVRAGCFRFKRALLWADGTPKKVTGNDADTDEPSKGYKPPIEKKKKTNIIKYTCPGCGLIIRASKKIDGMVKCIGCDEVFISE